LTSEIEVEDARRNYGEWARAQLAGKSDAEKAEIFGRAFELTCEQLALMAAVVVDFEKQGKLELIDRKYAGMIKYLRLVGHGRLLVEGLTKYYADVPKLKLLERVPLVDQERLVSEERFRVPVQRADGPSYLNTRFDDMTLEQARLVVGPRGIRSEDDRIRELETQSGRAPRARNRPGPYTISKKEQAVTFATDPPLTLKVEQLMDLIKEITRK